MPTLIDTEPGLALVHLSSWWCHGLRRGFMRRGPRPIVRGSCTGTVPMDRLDIVVRRPVPLSGTATVEATMEEAIGAAMGAVTATIVNERPR